MECLWIVQNLIKGSLDPNFIVITILFKSKNIFVMLLPFFKTFLLLYVFHWPLRLFEFIAPKHFLSIKLSNLSILSVPNDDYFRNACTLYFKFNEIDVINMVGII